jgi:hypothetical protein
MMCRNRGVFGGMSVAWWGDMRCFSLAVIAVILTLAATSQAWPLSTWKQHQAAQADVEKLRKSSFESRSIYRKAGKLQRKEARTSREHLMLEAGSLGLISAPMMMLTAAVVGAHQKRLAPRMGRLAVIADALRDPDRAHMVSPESRAYLARHQESLDDLMIDFAR